MDFPFTARRQRLALLLPSTAFTVLLAGCADSAYYLQSIGGHLEVLRAARPVQEWLDDAGASPALKARLQLAQRIRGFAVSELKLPDNPSYHRYADLHRRSVVWNVVAAPPYSLKARTWCFPVTGCVGYRGYYREEAAREEAEGLATQGLETTVYGVPAYSTLGWTNWIGGDPLLNTFLFYPEGELARMLFHELAHQVVYTRDDTPFNESFATAVERLGGARWLALEGSEAARAEYAAYDARRRAFRALTQATRHALDRIYEDDVPAGGQAAREARKAEAMQDFRARYAALRAGWGGDARLYAGYDAWVARANNASFAAQAAYDDLVPGFEALFEREGRDWQRFYDAVRRLAALPKAERHEALKNPNQETPGA